MVTIPFICSNPHKEYAKGAAISLICNANTEYKEPFSDFAADTFDSSGVYIAGLVNYFNNLKGVEAGFANLNAGGLEGIAMGGVNVFRELKGASVGVINYAEINKGLTVQIGGINVINEYNPAGTVIQIGLYNRAGEQFYPIINIRKKRQIKNLKKK